MSPRKRREPAEHGEHSLRTHGSSPTGLGVLCRSDKTFATSDDPSCNACRYLLGLPLRSHVPVAREPKPPKDTTPAPPTVTLRGFECADGCGRTLTIPHPSGVCRTCRGVPREGDVRSYRREIHLAGLVPGEIAIARKTSATNRRRA